MELDRRQFIEFASAAAAMLPSQGDDQLGVRGDFPAVRSGL